MAEKSKMIVVAIICLVVGFTAGYFLYEPLANAGTSLGGGINRKIMTGCWKDMDTGQIHCD